MQMENEKWCALILAGGRGQRFGNEENKVLVPLWDGETALVKSVTAFASFVGYTVVAAREEDTEKIAELLRDAANTVIVSGGETRQDSVWNGLQSVPDKCQYVLIHDAARCLVTGDIICRVKDSVLKFGSGVAAVPLTDTIKQTDSENFAFFTPERAKYRSIQTPQGFTVDMIRKAHINAGKDNFIGTDDASLCERMGVKVHLVDGDRRNMKLTNPEDEKIMECLSGYRQMQQMRIGHGYDVHRLVEGRKLVLCGVEVPHSMGLLGHSDADVAVHALMDAMLGAMAIGDIGKLFPDSDERYRGISSMVLLKKVTELLREDGGTVVNADITISAQKPKLAPFIDEMRSRVADTMSVSKSCVSVKATTTEGLGFEGREEGISATAVVIVNVIK